MKNPYEILGIEQNATTAQIVRAQMTALRKKNFSQREIADAQATLRKPALRLAADFTFPILMKWKMKTVTTAIKSHEMDVNKIDVNKYDSLKK